MPATLRRILDDLNRHLSAAPGAGISFRQLAALALFWAVGSLALLLFRPGYGFPPFELLDSWIYSSYHWDLRNQIADFGPTYYGSRLSWILPGALIHSLLPPVAAEICFKLAVSALFATACAAIVRRAAGPSAALLAVALSIIAPQFIVALHTDFTDTPVIVYATLALACITAARDSRRWVAWIFLGGCFFTGMTIANLSSLGTPGLGLAVFHLLWLRWGFKRQLACIGLYLLAALTVCLVLGGIHVLAGGAFFFLKPQIAMIFYVKDLKNSPWMSANWLWLAGATWLVVPVGTLLWGALCSLTKRVAHSEHGRLIQALTAALFVSLAWALMLEFKFNGVLDYYFYASYHLCLALPLLALLCWAGVEPSQRSASAAGTLILTLLAFVVAGKPLSAWHALKPLAWLGSSNVTLPVLAAGVFLLLGLMTALHVLPGGLRRICRRELLVLGLIVCSISSDFYSPPISDRLRERYRMVHDAYQALAREFPQGSYIFWHHPYEKSGVSLGSTKLWQYRLLTLEPFPKFAPYRFTEKTVVIPCPPGRGRESLEIARKVLAQLRIDLADQRVLAVPGDAGLGFDLACFSMRSQQFDPEHLTDGATSVKILLDLRFDAIPPYTSSLQANLYGLNHGAAIVTTSGYPVFTRTDPLDHLATPFITLAAPKPGVLRHLSLVVIMPAEGRTKCIVQTEGYQEIAQLSLHAKGRSTHLIVVPADRASLRIYLQGDTDQPTALPTQITIYEINP